MYSEPPRCALKSTPSSRRETSGPYAATARCRLKSTPSSRRETDLSDAGEERLHA